jgi:hypothetical protein
MAGYNTNNGLLLKKGGSRGSSSSSGSSSGSKGGSGTKGGSGSTASTVTRGSSITTARPFGGSPYYYGGSTVPYYGGLTSTRGIIPALILIGLITPHYGGYWGYHTNNVYEYNYDITLANGTVYHVHCLCISEYPCSCDAPENSTSTYVNDLPADRYRLETNGTQTELYINGTLDGQQDTAVVSLAHTIVGSSRLTWLTVALVGFVLL